MVSKRMSLLAAVLMAAHAMPTLAQDQPKEFSIQLNNLQPVSDACRMSFVIRNGIGAEIRDASIELVLFDKQDAVARMLAVNPGRLPAGRTRVKQFDVKGLACDQVGRLLLNDVKRCKGDGLTPAICLDAAKPSSRINVPFID